ncbi:MAG: alcohol dehydrogenase family protein [Alphaproteobacteria bacterium]|nr:alcohol dehydrogenase family protein [Alphaproteobacteria bacterium]
MKAVVTTGNGGYDKLVYRDVPVPVPSAGEVLIKVLAAGINNTEINTRLGWYSGSVTAGTDVAAAEAETEARARADGGWDKPTPFPFIQGTDCCGRVVEAHDEAGPPLIGKRVLVRACMRLQGYQSLENVWMASDFDGAFAEFVKVPASEVFPVDCSWSDAELATIPCAYGTAENMLHRASCSAGERVLITGASGGVGSAAVQLACCRGAHVVAVTSREKLDAVRQLGCDIVLDRNDDLLVTLGESSVDLVVDNVAGPQFNEMPKLLRRGGRYVSSGAIGGPIVSFDMRDFYLKDLTFIGCTAWDEPVFRNLVSYIERGKIRPLLAGTFPLERIADAQREFMRKRHIGNFVLIP